MGQYYLIIFLDSSSNIQAFVNIAYPCGMKLTEHAYLNNHLMNAIEFLLSPSGPFHKHNIVWAGDYADSEPLPPSTAILSESQTENNFFQNYNQKNLFKLASDQPEKEYVFQTPTIPEHTLAHTKKINYTYIVNHTKKLYANILKISKNLELHPLALLTAEGNGRGGGDYYGINHELCGCWARDSISMENIEPSSDYIEKWHTPLFE
jgi:hypothetical protein